MILHQEKHALIIPLINQLFPINSHNVCSLVGYLVVQYRDQALIIEQQKREKKEKRGKKGKKPLAACRI